LPNGRNSVGFSTQLTSKNLLSTVPLPYTTIYHWTRINSAGKITIHNAMLNSDLTELDITKILLKQVTLIYPYINPHHTRLCKKYKFICSCHILSAIVTYTQVICPCLKYTITFPLPMSHLHTNYLSLSHMNISFLPLSHKYTGYLPLSHMYKSYLPLSQKHNYLPLSHKHNYLPLSHKQLFAPVTQTQ
jgi:hypothetical protein